MNPPHVEKILKLLMLSGRGNPNAHERESARKMAEVLMQRHGVSVEQMRELYRKDMGLPPRSSSKPKPPTGKDTRNPSRPKARQARARPAPMTTAEIEALLQETVAREAILRAQHEAWDRATRLKSEANRAEEHAEREALTKRFRAVIDQTLSLHSNFPVLMIHLGAFSILAVVREHEPLGKLLLRWPPARVAIRLDYLGPSYDWPSLLQRGLRFDPNSRQHRETGETMIML